MLTRRLLAQASRPSCASTVAVRPFHSTSSLPRAPALADLTPDNAAEFDRRQNQFRESQRAAAKAKEEQDRESRESLPSPASFMSMEAETIPNVISKLPLGSLTTATTGAAREKAAEQESSKRKGRLANLIYGTKEGQQHDQEIEKSFSQVLARGKYVHSIVFHEVKPDKVDEYVELVGGWYPRMAKLEDNHVHLVGSWRTEVGDCDTFGVSIISPNTLSL
jgi:hypothetical protein